MPATLPLALLRLATLPTTALEPFHSPQLSVAMRNLSDAVKQRDKLAQEASDGLAKIVPTVSKLDRRALLNLRRNLFNSRAPASALKEASPLIADTSTQQVVSACAAAILRVDENVALVRHAYDECWSKSEHAVIELSSASPIADGLALSSADLFDASRRVGQRTTTGDRLPAQTRRGLLRYLVRTASKATPFSKFCLVSAVRLESDASKQAVLRMRWPQTVQSLVRLNKAHFSAFWDAAKQNPDLQNQLPLELNYTIASTDAAVQFLVSKGRIEVFQTISQTPALRVLCACAQQGDRLTVDLLVSELLRHEEIDTTDGEARVYVKALIRSGLLSYVCPVESQDADWARTFAKFLRSFERDSAALCANHLDDAQRTVGNYHELAPGERREAINRVRDDLTRALAELDPEARLWQPSVLFEDYGSPDTLSVTGAESLELAITAIGKLMERLAHVAWPLTGMMTMRHYYDATMPSAPFVPLLEFYRRFAKDHLKEYMADQELAANGSYTGDPKRLTNPFNLPQVEMIVGTQARWRANLFTAVSAGRDADEVNLRMDEVFTLDASMAHGVPRPMSVATFAQIAGVTSAGSRRTVVKDGQMYLGFGKYFSRFLDVVSPDLTDIVREANSRHEVILTEIGTDSNFNANLHPQLVDHCLRYPSVDATGLPTATAISDVYVRPSALSSHALELFDRRTGERLVPLDLGFLNVRLRPALFQLLLRFAPLGGVGIGIPSHEAIHAAVSGSPSKILHRPRVVLEDVVVVARRSWLVPCGLLPDTSAAIDSFESFVRFAEWREKNGIPERVFARFVAPRTTSGVQQPPHEAPQNPDEDIVLQQPEKTKEAAREAKGRSGDFYKPWLISFDSPLLVDLASQTFRRASGFDVLLEEVDPDLADNILADGQPHASELVLQYDW